MASLMVTQSKCQMAMVIVKVMMMVASIIMVCQKAM